MSLRVVLVYVVLSASGCYVGPTVQDLRFARDPQGIRTQIVLRDAQLDGELLEVRNAEILVLNADRELCLVPYGAIREGKFERMRHLTIRRGSRPEHGVREQLRLLSRFPQGLDDEMTKRLLEAYGQAEFRVLQ